MRFSDALSLLRRLGTPGLARRGLFIASLVLAERFLVTAAAWALFGRSLLYYVVSPDSLSDLVARRLGVQTGSRRGT